MGIAMVYCYESEFEKRVYRFLVIHVWEYSVKSNSNRRVRTPVHWGGRTSV